MIVEDTVGRWDCLVGLSCRELGSTKNKRRQSVDSVKKLERVAVMYIVVVSVMGRWGKRGGRGGGFEYYTLESTYYLPWITLQHTLHPLVLTVLYKVGYYTTPQGSYTTILLHRQDGHERLALNLQFGVLRN